MDPSFLDGCLLILSDVVSIRQRGFHRIEGSGMRREPGLMWVLDIATRKCNDRPGHVQSALGLSSNQIHCISLGEVT